MSKQPARGRYRTPDVTAPQLRSVALVQLIATATLALSTLIAGAAVSIGHTRAEVVPFTIGADAVPFARTTAPRDRAA
jgi:hypothetical protein